MTSHYSLYLPRLMYGLDEPSCKLTALHMQPCDQLLDIVQHTTRVDVLSWDQALQHRQRL